MPWCTDGPNEAELGGWLETTVSDWADRCHEQQGTVVIPHFPLPNGEPAVLIATGRADAIEMIVQRRAFHEEYYSYLNCGYRLPLVGGTDKMTAEVPVGVYRTYANLGEEEFSHGAWSRSVRAGRTFLSAGPIIGLRAEGCPVGDTVRMSGPGVIHVSARAESIFPVWTLQIVQNGQVVAAADEPAGARRIELHAEIRVDGNCWLAARLVPGHLRPHIAGVRGVRRRVVTVRFRPCANDAGADRGRPRAGPPRGGQVSRRPYLAPARRGRSQRLSRAPLPGGARARDGAPSASAVATVGG